ncbi:hypothetical protein HHK36_029370 [Tetracentron sinense]|uniref:Cation/H+ exchanger domain-containing protein n=1 Tax=Tetracentron sinense TaxID=13715 RepID=A0A835CZA3_TETSI|nr:hypothetical protein HHK36_029370 [Tetracentron sinense]
MGSLAMEPDDIKDYTGDLSAFRNLTTICMSAAMVQSNGIYFGSNPLHYSAPLLFLQLALSSTVVGLTGLLLKPLGQPVMVSHILGGIILGPSLLGRSHAFTSLIFPLRSLILLDNIAVFGIMFHFFQVGVQMDPWIILKTGKKAFAIGISVVLIPMIVSTSCASLLVHFSTIDQRMLNSLPIVAAAESVLAFPTVARYLQELKILNSEFGRVALSSSMISGIVSFSIMTLTVLWKQDQGKIFKLLITIVTGTVLVIFIVFVVRPVVMWMVGWSREGEPLKAECIYAVFLSVLVTGFLSHVTGLHILFGPLVLGMALPAGPPLGSAIVEKLDIMISWMFMPIYFVKNGLVMNVFTVPLKHVAIVQLIILAGCTGKFFGALLPSLYCKMPLRDALSIGLVMNAQGVLELGLFKMLKGKRFIDGGALIVMSASMLVVTGAMTPLIRHLYNPSRRYAVYKRRTILHSRPNIELRVLACIHDQENVPTVINLLEASNPTKRSPIVIYAVHLLELVGRATPLLIPHRLSKRPSSSAHPSEHIVNAFRHYEQGNLGAVSVNPFTSVAPYATMHDDVCTLALGKRTDFIIIPFHKHYATGGTMESSKSGFRAANNNILENAPCSVGILVDRGLLAGSCSVLATWSSYRVAVLFVGGPDDREALALGARMAGHPNINFTMVRLLENGNISSDDQTSEVKLDNEVVSEFKNSIAGNDRAMYIEEVVMEGSGTVAVLRSMENNYELIIVGRRYNKGSPLTSGLTDWNEYTELGVIGDILASQDFKGKTTILVVQQHAIIVAADLQENSENQGMNFRELSLQASEEVFEEEGDDVPIRRRSTFARL